MKGRLMILALAVSALLAGCNWPNGSYQSVTAHQEQWETDQDDVISASEYGELIDAMKELVSMGTETAAIHVTQYPAESLEQGMEGAIRYVMQTDPLGSYAVEDVAYEIGASAGHPAVAVTITYRVSPTKIRYIRRVADPEAAWEPITNALERYDTGIVILVEDYAETDFTQFVQSYAQENPQIVMEIPQVTENLYGRGRSRVAELTFTYQNSRDNLRNMHAQVEPVFNAAALYVSGDGSQRQKFSQLYAFLMERFDYTLETSITPAYSLLCHGVGDSKAFATVYAAMCRTAGLECRIVTGTCDGEPRTWNMVEEDGEYYHVDLLRCNALGEYRQFTDGEMDGYVWDYSAYPACTGTGAAGQQESTEPESSSVAPPQTEAETDPTGETDPSGETDPAEETDPPEETDPAGETEEPTEPPGQTNPTDPPEEEEKTAE